MRLLWLLIGSLSNSQHGQNKEDTINGEGKRALQVRMRVEVHAEAQESPVLVDSPAPGIEQQAPTQEELEHRMREAKRLGEGGSQELSLT